MRNISPCWRRGIPLPLYVMIVVVLMVSLVSLLNLGFLFRESAKLGQAYAVNTFSMSTKAMVRTIRGQIDPVLSTISMYTSFDLRTFDRTWPDLNQALLFDCIQTLTSHSNLLAVNFGFADGSFFSVTNLHDDRVRTRYKAPAGSMFAIWAVLPEMKGQPMREYWRFLDAGYRELETRIEAPDYDPRTKLWYKHAMETGALTMTEPYVFTTSQQLGMAVAAPLRGGQGVFSVNMSLRNFDAVIGDVPVPEGGYLFLLDSAGRIVSERLPQETPQAAPLLDLGHHPSPEVVLASSQLEACLHSGGAITVDVNGRDYFMACRRLSMGSREVDVVLMAPVDAFMRLIRSFLSSTTAFSLGTLLVFMLCGGWLALRMGKTLTRLLHETLQVRLMSEEAGVSIPSQVREIRRLAHAIAGLKRSIMTRTKALRTARDTLEQTVAERTAELVFARDEAQIATKAKSAFLSTVSHEIRTPMNAIVGFSYLFETGNLTERQVDYLDKIRISSETLLRIINDVLDLSKIEAGRMELESTPFSLRSLLDTLSSIIRFPAENKGLTVEIHADDAVPDLLYGDPTRLHQILLNLLNNAVKFTASGSVVLTVVRGHDAVEHEHRRLMDRRLSTEQLPDEGERRSGLDRRAAIPLIFRVTDTGIGMNDEQLGRLFVPFSQADNTITRRYGGTGLGLAICRQLTQIMGGQISVSSLSGVGTTFEVSVRLHEAQKLEKPTSVIDLDRAWQSNALVLVVEDNEINREIIAGLMEKFKLRLEFAEDGAQAVAAVQQKSYDLVLMDMQMPVMDGLQATRIIRELGEQGLVARELPIVAMTANAMLEDRMNCLKAGMNDHLAKPLLPETLFAVLAHWLPAATSDMQSVFAEPEPVRQNATDAASRVSVQKFRA